MPGGESLAGVCAGRRRRRSHRRAGGAQRRSSVASTTLRCAVVAYFLNAGSHGKLTARRRDGSGVPQQAGRRLARQVTRSAGRERPPGPRGKPPSALERGVAHAPIAVSRCRQAAADSAAAVRGGIATVDGKCMEAGFLRCGCDRASRVAGSVARWRVSLDKGGQKPPGLLSPPLSPLRWSGLVRSRQAEVRLGPPRTGKSLTPSDSPQWALDSARASVVRRRDDRIEGPA